LLDLRSLIRWSRLPPEDNPGVQDKFAGFSDPQAVDVPPDDAIASAYGGVYTRIRESQKDFSWVACRSKTASTPNPSSRAKRRLTRRSGAAGTA